MIDRRGVLRMAIFGAVAFKLSGCDFADGMTNQHGESFDGFAPGEEGVVLFASANRNPVCGEGVDILFESAPKLLERHKLFVFMPDIDNTNDHSNLEKFRGYLGHRNFELITGSNAVIKDFARKHGAEYTFWSNDSDAEVMAHTPNPLLLTADQSVARVIPVKRDETVTEFIAKINEQLAFNPVFTTRDYG